LNPFIEWIIFWNFSEDLLIYINNEEITALIMYEVTSKYSTIAFVMGGEIVEVGFPDNGELTPTTTVLNYLRSLADRKGTKEGCAEGDCGACTVVLGEIGSDGSMHYRSVDSCLLFLPMLHGKQLITVEDLRDTDGKLHSVQTALVETNGSQCGYCTPGFIMSLFAMYKNTDSPSRYDIDDSLTGNLCRCTGYRSIVEAAAKACVHNSMDHFTGDESRVLGLLRSIRKESIHLKTSAQEYIRPTSLGEAISLKHQHHNAIVICGATDIALRVTKSHELLPFIIDISDLQEIKNITEDETSIRIGAGVTMQRLMPSVKRLFPAFYEMLSVFGSLQIRNMATLGGNLGTASPIGDTLPVLIAYGARVALEGLNGRREFPLDEYFIGYRKTKRKADEFITSIIIPKLVNGVLVRSYKVSKRKDLDISTVSAGFKLELDESSNVRTIILAYGGMAERTKRAVSVESFLLAKPWERPCIEEAMQYIDSDFTPISDARGSAEMRRVAARNLLLKFWSETKAGNGEIVE
jgi:xanthine dehydrogenase small subunit